MYSRRGFDFILFFCPKASASTPDKRLWKAWAKVWNILKNITNKQKPQLNRFRRPEFEALMLHDDSRVQQEEERILFFPDKDSASEKP